MAFDIPGKPEDIPRLFAEAWNARKPDALAALFEEDAEFVNVVGLWWHNKEDIKKAHAYGLKTIFNTSHLEIRQIKTKMLSLEIAVVHCRMKLSGQSSQGNVQKPAARFNLFSFVVRNNGSQWLCAAAHNTDIIPGKETNIVDETGTMQAVDYRKK